MHVLHLPSWYPTKQRLSRGTYFREQFKALGERGLSVGVAFPELRSLRTLPRLDAIQNRFQVTVAEEDDLRTVRVKAWNVPQARLRAWLFARLAGRCCHCYCRVYGRPDLVHGHGALRAGTAALRLRREHGIPYVLTEHSSRVLGRDLRRWECARIERVVESARKVSAVSSPLADAVASVARGAVIRVIPNMVDTDFFTLPPGGRVGSQDGPFRFLAAGNLHPKKGFDLLIRAFALAFPASDEVELVIAGEGREEVELKRLASRLSVGDRVRFPGFLSRYELRNQMWRSDTFVLSSRQETFGIVLIEAMATGLPVVATRSGGPQELVSGAVGRMCEAGKPMSLAELMEEARVTSGFGVDPREVRERVVQAYSIEQVCRRYIRLYQRAAGGGR